MSRRPTLLTVVLLVSLAIQPAHAQQGPTQAELDAAASNAADWLLPNHDYGGQRFVDATEITRDNASRLRPACVFETHEPARSRRSPWTRLRVRFNGGTTGRPKPGGTGRKAAASP
jgi:glucose dehydrogenase